MKKPGLTLLEVILALAILGAAMAILGEVSRLSLQNAGITGDLGRAQELLETKLSDIAAGIETPDPVSKTPFDISTDGLDPEDGRWLYSVDQDSNSSNEPGLLSVKVTVSRNLPEAQHPLQLSATEWVPDPNFTPETVSSGGTSSTSSSSGGGNGS